MGNMVKVLHDSSATDRYDFHQKLDRKALFNIYMTVKNSNLGIIGGAKFTNRC